VAIVVAAAAGGFAGTLRQSTPPAQVTASGAQLAMLFRTRPQQLPGSRLPQQTAV
jgi:hypothetical protein